MLYIFTPTFNRGYRLSYLYDSLCNQTNKNFIWLIVDDGSEDSTKEIVSNYIK
ncbi:TPA: glycosyltransferase family A protein, partial [Streptococcus agalactiae]